MKRNEEETAPGMNRIHHQARKKIRFLTHRPADGRSIPGSRVVSRLHVKPAAFTLEINQAALTGAKTKSMPFQ
jgi:hypothetical protein